MLRLGAGLMARGFAVDVVVGQARGELLAEVPPGARIVQLDKGHLWRAVAYGLASEPGAWKLLAQLKLKPLKRLFRRLPALVDYFRSARPDAVFAAEPGYSAIAVWARRLSGLRGRVVVSERIQVSRYAPVRSPWGSPRQRPLLQRAYLKADAIVAVSDGVANDLATYAGIPRERIRDGLQSRGRPGPDRQGGRTPRPPLVRAGRAAGDPGRRASRSAEGLRHPGPGICPGPRQTRGAPASSSAPTARPSWPTPRS